MPRTKKGLLCSTIAAWVGIKSAARHAHEERSRREIAEANAYVDRLHADPVYGPLWSLIRQTVGDERSGRRRQEGQEEVAAKRLAEVLKGHPDYEVISWRGDYEGTLPGGSVRHRETSRIFDITVFLNLGFALTERSGDRDRWSVA